jgi:hypothetical protein
MKHFGLCFLHCNTGFVSYEVIKQWDDIFFGSRSFSSVVSLANVEKGLLKTLWSLVHIWQVVTQVDAWFPEELQYKFIYVCVYVSGGDSVLQRYVLCLVTGGLHVQICLEPLHSDPGQIAHPQLSVRKAIGNHLTHIIPGWHKSQWTCLWAKNSSSSFVAGLLKCVH